MTYHETLADAKRFIVWYATNEADVSEWDKTRYADAVAMVRAIDSLHSRTPSDGAVAMLCEVAFARMSRAAFKVDYHRRCEFLDAQWKYLHEGPSLALLREMERVTGELGGEE